MIIQTASNVRRSQGKECSFCHKMNHFAKMCMSRKSKYKGQQKGVNRLDDYGYTSSDETDDDRFYDDELYVSMLFNEMKVNKISDEWIVNSSIFIKTFQCKLTQEPDAI